MWQLLQLFSIFLVSIDGQSVEVRTTSGLVRGQTITSFNQRVDQFLGIPYAEPPIGDLRFARPVPIRQPRQNVIDATQPKASCYGLVTPQPMSEDCLFLNIWTQNTSSYSLRPVMYYIYGGSFTGGSIFTPGLTPGSLLYNGSVLAVNDVVFVSVNYRVGVFGYTYFDDLSAPGNQGFYDQTLGLKWVRNNIHLFGGDKNQITIVGVSSGSLCVSALILSPISRGLYRRAIMESGALFFNLFRDPNTPADGLNQTRQLARSVNCNNNNQVLTCLRKVNANQLQGAYRPAGGNQLPMFNTEFLPYNAQQSFHLGEYQKDLDILAGVAQNDGTIIGGPLPNILNGNVTMQDFVSAINYMDLFLHNMNKTAIVNFYLDGVYQSNSDYMLQAIFDYVGDVLFKCPTYFFAEFYAMLSSNPFNVYFYDFTRVLSFPDSLLSRLGLTPAIRQRLGAYHGEDSLYVSGIPQINPGFDEIDIKLSKQVIKWWTDFAKYGTPRDKWLPMLYGRLKISNLIKDINGNEFNEYFTDLFDKTCDRFWRSYYIG